ncbi:hypothetical protein ACY2PI_004567, partial [Citrobacter amalonaticus]
MMPSAAALAINQVQLWNECNKMAIFGGAGGMCFHVISLKGPGQDFRHFHVTSLKGSVRFMTIASLELTHPRT